MGKVPVVFIVAFSLLSSSCVDSYTLYGSSPKAYSFATHETTSTFMFRNKNADVNYRLVKPSHIALHPAYGKVASIPYAYQQNVVADIVSPSSFHLLPNDSSPVLGESTAAILEKTENEVKNAVVSNIPTLAGDAVKAPINGDLFKKPPTIHRVTYSIPVEEPLYTIERSPGVNAPPVSFTELQNISNEVGGVRKENVLAIQPLPVEEEVNSLKKEPESTFHEIPTIVKNVDNPSEKQEFEVAPLPKIEQINEGQQAYDVNENDAQKPIENRQGAVSNFEQPITFFPPNPPVQRENLQTPDNPSVPFPIPGNNRFALPPVQKQPTTQPPQQFAPELPPPPQLQPGFFSGSNRFTMPSQQQSPQLPSQQQNEQPLFQQQHPQLPPPPMFNYPRNFNIGPGGGPPPEEENGYNPYHMFERFPEPPYESEFSNEPSIRDDPIEQTQRSAGNSPPPPLDFTQSTLREVSTEELLQVIQRKSVPVECAYNTISYGPNGEDCVQTRKR